MTWPSLTHQYNDALITVKGLRAPRLSTWLLSSTWRLTKHLSSWWARGSDAGFRERNPLKSLLSEGQRTPRMSAHKLIFVQKKKPPFSPLLMIHTPKDDDGTNHHGLKITIWCKVKKKCWSIGRKRGIQFFCLLVNGRILQRLLLPKDKNLTSSILLTSVKHEYNTPSKRMFKCHVAKAARSSLSKAHC